MVAHLTLDQVVMVRVHARQWFDALALRLACSPHFVNILLLKYQMLYLIFQ